MHEFATIPTIPDEGASFAYYRGKCLACHGAAFGAKHHGNRPDCTECHILLLRTTDVAHTQVRIIEFRGSHRCRRSCCRCSDTEITPAWFHFPASQKLS